jgi:hypothetical protein
MIRRADGIFRVIMRSIIRKIHSSHIITFLLSLTAALFWAVQRHVPQASTEKRSPGPEIELQIAAVTGLAVHPNSIAWISGPPSSSFNSAVTWHEVLFLAQSEGEVPADLYRAEVRAVHPKAVFGIRGLRNLSQTKVGEEYNLTASPPLAAVATRVLGQIRSVTLYQFNKNAESHRNEWTSVSSWLNQITNYMETGRAVGLEKELIRFTRPPASIDMAFDGETLTLRRKDLQGTISRTEIHSDGKITGDDDIVVTPSMKLAKQPLLWLVDTVRGLSCVGPGPIEWAEGRFFALKDAITRARYALFGEEDTVETEDVAPRLSPVKLDLPAGLEVGKQNPKEIWPPPRFDPPVYKRRLPGEGTWRPAAPDFLKTLPGAPPAFYRSITRPDGARPYVKVDLFAMDMRQMTVHMVGGLEDPQSTTGSTGTGRFPRRPEILNRLVVAFNGAFKTEHGEYGMIVEKDELLPPKPGAATVASLEDGTTLVGSWPKDFNVPENLVSLRQNMDPVVENGVINPRRRYLWGFTLDEDITEMHTIRSGLCMSDKGYLVYAWGEDLTAQTLGTAMDAAGCVYGIHLDMNPFHTSFIFYDIEKYENPGEYPKYKAEVALKEMRYSPPRYVNGAPKDFFFLTLRDSSPGPGWNADGLAQPAPAFLPAVFRRSAGNCTLVAVDRSRTAIHLDHGTIPTSLSPVTGDDARDDTEADLLVMASLGPWSSVRGQLVNETIVASLTDHRATLGIGDTGDIKMGAWPLQDENQSIVGNAIQGHWLEDDSLPDDEVVALGFDRGWRIIGAGPRVELSKEFKRIGVGRAIAFASSQADESPVSLAVRGKKGMLDAAGSPVASRDRRAATLHITAKPKALGARRLETAFGLPPVNQKTSTK